MSKQKVGYILVMLQIAALIYAYTGVLPRERASSMEVLPIAAGALGGAALWFWMLINFISNRKKIKRPVMWGLSLIAFNWIAAIVYFFIIYPKVAART